MIDDYPKLQTKMIVSYPVVTCKMLSGVKNIKLFYFTVGLIN